MNWNKIQLILNHLIIICGFCLLLYALLNPSKSIGTLDTSLFGTLYLTNGFDSIIFTSIIIYGILILYSIKSKMVQQIDILLFLFMLIFAIILSLQSLRDVHTYSLLIIANMCIFSIIFICFSFVRKYAVYAKYYKIVLYGVFVLYSVYIFYAIYFNKELPVSNIIYHYDTEQRLSIMFSNPNHLGNFLAFGIIYLFCTVIMTSKRWIALLWCTITILIIGLIHTYSRGAWLGCIVGFIIAILYLKTRVVTRVLIKNVVILTIIIVVSLLITPNGYLSVFNRVSHSHPSMDASVGHRIDILKSAFLITYDHWISGVGIGQFGDVLERGYKPPYLKNIYYVSSMNNYITLAAEVGVPATLLYILCIGIACIIASKRLSNGFSSASEIGMLCGVYSMLIFACTTYTLGQIYAIVLMWSVLGYLVAIPQQSRENKDDIQ